LVKRLNGQYRNNTLLVKPKGEDEYAVAGYRGLHFIRMTISSPQPEATLKANIGVDGQIQQGPILYTSRTAKADFWLEVKDGVDLEGRLHEIYNKFFNRELIRLRQTYDIGRCVYGIPKPFSYTDFGFYDKTFSIEFDIPSAYMYSIARSTDFPLDVDKAVDLVSTSMNLPETDFSYTHTNGVFKIYNPSDFDIQPYEQNHELNINFVGSGSPNLTNTDTGDLFQLTRSISNADSLILKGVHPFLNGEACEIDTNHGHINLKKGWNNFNLTGFSGTATFDFPFIYK